MTVDIMIVDDHPVFRQGLKSILDGEHNCKIVAEAEDGEVAIRILNQIHVDLVLLDVRMPKLNGIATLSRIKTLRPKIAVIMLTTFDDPAAFKDAVRIGVNGFLLKDADSEMIFKAIDEALSGRVMVDPTMMKKSVDSVKSKYELSTENLDILTMVAKGEHNADIARELHLSERTVKGRLTSIYNVLNVDSRSAAVAKAVKLQLIEL